MGWGGEFSTYIHSRSKKINKEFVFSKYRHLWLTPIVYSGIWVLKTIEEESDLVAMLKFLEILQIISMGDNNMK